MDPSSWTLHRKRSQRRRRPGQTLSYLAQVASNPRNPTLKSSEQEEEESPSIPRIPPLALAETLSAVFKMRTQLRLTLPLTTPSRQLRLIGSSILRFQRQKYLIASLILSGTVIITAPVTKRSLLVEQSVELNLKVLLILLGATALYAASAQSMLQ
uniref:Uncharacterized protein n=1 Tax=Cherry rusty mottle associated virus TaxID=1312929 RepID=V5LXF5_9VIRU|nr:hypothetical protein [Cherry rusty mottle associated virus]AHA59475.1 hypothetical protein [Cherry rusty mottle associated virus]AHA59479.1 hypothetical protein [Cherry rusty mottle associated virus]